MSVSPAPGVVGSEGKKTAMGKLLQYFIPVPTAIVKGTTAFLASPQKPPEGPNSEAEYLHERWIFSSLDIVCPDPANMEASLLQLELEGNDALFIRQDLPTAERFFQRILAVTGKTDSQTAEYVKKAGLALRVIQLRRTASFEEALAVVSEIESAGQVEDLLGYQGFYPDSSLSSLTYLQLLVLGDSLDVDEIQLLSFSREDQVDRETKTVNDYNAIAVRRGRNWTIIDNGGMLVFDQEEFEGYTFDQVIFSLEQTNGVTFYGVRWERGLFTDRDADHKSSYLADRTEEMAVERAADTLVKLLFMGKFVFGLSNDRSKIRALNRAFQALPKSNFDGLRFINFNWSSPRRYCGQFREDASTVDIACADPDVIFHEVIHSWEAGAVGWLSEIFYSISWEEWSPDACGSEFIDKKKKMDDENYAWSFIPCGWWVRRPDADPFDFSREYGMSDGREDLATSGESYMGGIGILTREEVREQMAGGNFEPAAKYLFHKYVRSFDPEDGLCFEYNITPDDPPLSLAEVKAQRDAWLAEHPDSISSSTLAAISDIEDFYQSASLSASAA